MAEKIRRAVSPLRRGLITIPIIAVVATAVLIVVRADESVVTFEAEQPGSSHIVNDSSASGGQAIEFRDPGGGTPDLSALNDPAGLSVYNQFANYSSSQVNALGNHPQYGAFVNDAFTRSNSSPPVIPDDNGTHSQGQFRILCSVSHFGYDDPLIFPGQPGRAHLHMFWGNTNVDAHTGFNTPSPSNNLLERGGSTCQSGVLNRSAYWAPAMFAGGAGAGRQIVMPKAITLYYKSHKPTQTQPLPQGIQLLIGNVNPGGSVNNSFTVRESLAWGCYDPSQGLAVNRTSTIPGTNGTAQCPNGWDIQASIQFPQCIAMSGGQPVLSSSDFVSHTHILESGGHGQQNDPCPSSHPYRVPQISYLIRWANPSGLDEASWRLSSDLDFDKPTGQVPHPGGSLHGDWLGAWHDGAIQAWIDGCMHASRNCTLGQTGQNGTGRSFQRITGTHLSGMFYDGPQLFDDPAPNYTGHSHN